MTVHTWRATHHYFIRGTYFPLNIGKFYIPESVSSNKRCSFPPVILATNINCISLPCKERQTGSRHIHVMSGCPAELHWAATLLFHVAMCTLALIIPTVIAAASLDRDKTIDQPDMLGVCHPENIFNHGWIWYLDIFPRCVNFYAQHHVDGIVRSIYGL